MDWLTTSTLLRDLREFDRGEAWNGFVERFRRPIITFARGLGLSTEDAEDVAQEALVAFAAAYRQGKYDREKGRLSRWLFGFAYRYALKARQRNARRESLLGPSIDRDLEISAIPQRDSASRMWDFEWERVLLESCLDCVRQEVEPATFGAFEMTALQNRPVAEVASALETSVTAVYNARYRVLKRLREIRDLFEEVK